MSGKTDDSVGAGALVLSLDFELGWGNLERMEHDREYQRAVMGARAVVPRLLAMFEEFEVAATWAVVGLLFGDDRGEWFGRRARGGGPTVLVPRMVEGYRSLDEASEPAWLAPSLIREIVRARRHEIATHTFSHFYWMDECSTLHDFRQDLRAARAVAQWWGLPLRSIVFPRNQYEPVVAPALLEAGITAYRGNPPSSMWQFHNTDEGNHPVRRAARLLDAYVPGFPQRTQSWSEVLEPSGLSNVRASFFLRPFVPGLRALEGRRLARLQNCMRGAAERGEILHLWCHPHNFGLHTEENLGFLRRLLETFHECRWRYGMCSMTMGEVDRAVRAASGSTQKAAS